MMQTPSMLSEILHLLVDPVTGERLESARDERGVISALRSPSTNYPVIDGVPHLLPTESEISALVGLESYKAWRALQVPAEESYRVRLEGHFSVPSYQPAVDYGERISGAPSGMYLDVGCGRLETPAYMLASPDKRFVGIDPMDIAATRSFPFARALGDFLPFAGRSFDGLLFSSALDHCISPQRALSEARRVVRPGGALLIFETLRPDDRRYRMWLEQALRGPAQYNKHHNWAFTETSLQEVVTDAGFVVRSLTRTSDPGEGVLKATRP